MQTLEIMSSFGSKWEMCTLPTVSLQFSYRQLMIDIFLFSEVLDIHFLIL